VCHATNRSLLRRYVRSPPAPAAAQPARALRFATAFPRDMFALPAALRWRIIRSHLAGVNAPATAYALQVSVSTVYKMVALWERTGDVESPRRRGARRLLSLQEEQTVEDAIRKYTTLYLDEIMVRMAADCYDFLCHCSRARDLQTTHPYPTSGWCRGCITTACPSRPCVAPSPG